MVSLSAAAPSFSWAGLFLVVKATHEIYGQLEGAKNPGGRPPQTAGLSFGSAVAQIAMLDIVFSLDSVITTAVGMAQAVWVMIIAVVLAVVVVMVVFSRPVSNFIARHPTMRMLALSFLILDRGAASDRRHGLAHRARLRLLRHGLLHGGGAELLNMRVRSTAKGA